MPIQALWLPFWLVLLTFASPTATANGRLNADDVATLLGSMVA